MISRNFYCLERRNIRGYKYTSRTEHTHNNTSGHDIFNPCTALTRTAWPVNKGRTRVNISHWTPLTDSPSSSQSITGRGVNTLPPAQPLTPSSRALLHHSSQLVLQYHYPEYKPVRLTLSIYTAPLIVGCVIAIYVHSLSILLLLPLSFSFPLSLSLSVSPVIHVNLTPRKLCQMRVSPATLPFSLCESHLSQALPTSLRLLFHLFPSLSAPLSFLEVSLHLPSFSSFIHSFLCLSLSFLGSSVLLLVLPLFIFLPSFLPPLSAILFSVFSFFSLSLLLLLSHFFLFASSLLHSPFSFSSTFPFRYPLLSLGLFLFLFFHSASSSLWCPSLPFLNARKTILLTLSLFFFSFLGLLSFPSFSSSTLHPPRFGLLFHI